MNYKILDFTILAMVMVFFVGILSFDYYVVGLQNPLILISSDWKPFLDFLIYPIVALLATDLALKYRKEKNPKKFVKKYWIDIIMLILIPVFSMFKFFKIGASLAKQLKTIKMGAKAAHKTKKISKK
jgi:lysylphosphatidylglycerol synthetase-like protein (DUF2156 family)